MCFILAILILYIFWDVNYLLRTYFIVLNGRIFEKPLSLNGCSSIYGICTLRDCDVSFKSLRLARLIRMIDFARYHYYDMTGIYERSKILGIHGLQGCTLSSTMEPVGLFQIYRIDTRVIYWDDRSLFFEHTVVTPSDGKVRNVIVSRQHAIGKNGESTDALLKGLTGAENRPTCPEYIKIWLQSMNISSANLKKNVKIKEY